MEEFSPIGTLVKLSHYHLHAYQIGKGNPTVVFVSGAGNDCLIWQLVQPKVAKFTSTLSYDRAGLGWSESTDNPRTAEFIAHELQQLLINSDSQPPYVMVGHSMGGIYARKYAQLFPDTVVGMVLVDSPHEELNLHLPQRIREADRKQEQEIIHQMQQYLELMSQMSHEEFIELSKKPEGQPEPFPSEIVALRRDRVRPKTIQAMIDEMKALEGNTSQQWEQTSILDSKPLVILIAQEMQADVKLTDEENILADNIVKRAQQDLSILSCNSQTIVVPDSSHFIQVDQPQAIVNAIREVLETI